MVAREPTLIDDLHRFVARDASSTNGAGPPSELTTSTAPTLDPAALHGLPGDVVRALDPHTEGAPVATLGNYLLMLGSAAGSGPHARVGERRHPANEFAVVVGDTSKGRKGTSHDAPEAIVGEADPSWRDRILGGLSSGEGLVHAIRDRSTLVKEGQEVEVDAGVSDKRLLAVEEEFSGVCKIATRDGNILSETIRRAWDAKPLGNLTKQSAERCREPHVSILGHVTRTELLRVLDTTDAANGFGNRFLWVSVARSKLLPEGGRLPDDTRAELVRRTREVLTAARRRSELRRDEEARALWKDVYPDLSAPSVGLNGAMTDRAEAHVLRLSLLYALADGSGAITTDHLMAALALWDYCAASARHIFGEALGDPIADRIYDALRASGPMDRTQINTLLGRNVNAARIAGALEVLRAAGRACSSKEAPEGGVGRLREMWTAT